MSILAWIIVGLIAGLIARALVPGEEPGGLLADLLVGILGAVVGGWIFNALGIGGVTGFNLWSIWSPSSARPAAHHLPCRDRPEDCLTNA